MGWSQSPFLPDPIRGGVNRSVALMKDASLEELQAQQQLRRDLQHQTAICLLLISLFQCVSKA